MLQSDVFRSTVTVTVRFFQQGGTFALGRYEAMRKGTGASMESLLLNSNWNVWRQVTIL